jgi:S1-C subfamily serine protease
MDGESHEAVGRMAGVWSKAVGKDCRATAGFCGSAGRHAGEGAESGWSNWVLKIEVMRLDGRELGSGVAIGPQRVIANCHVVRNARTIRVLRGKEVRPASMEAGDEYRDL